MRFLKAAARDPDIARRAGIKQQTARNLVKAENKRKSETKEVDNVSND